MFLTHIVLYIYNITMGGYDAEAPCRAMLNHAHALRTTDQLTSNYQAFKIQLIKSLNTYAESNDAESPLEHEQSASTLTGSPGVPLAN